MSQPTSAVLTIIFNYSSPTYLLSLHRIVEANFDEKLIIASATDNASPVLGTIQYIKSYQITSLYHW
jgi:hypothetical protein